MNIQDVIYYFLPLGITLAALVLVIRKTGAFEQRAHRAKVEALLERIAVAVEKKHES